MDYYAQSESYWDDMTGPALIGKVAATAPDWDATYGMYLFSNILDEAIFLTWQIPHHYSDASGLKPHAHWCKTTSASGNVEWQLEYRWAKVGEVITSYTTISDYTPDVSDGDTAYQHALTGLGTISGTGASLSDILLGKLTRLGSSGGNDDYGADAGLLYCDIHYQGRNFGSLNETSRA